MAKSKLFRWVTGLGAVFSISGLGDPPRAYWCARPGGLSTPSYPWLKGRTASPSRLGFRSQTVQARISWYFVVLNCCLNEYSLIAAPCVFTLLELLHIAYGRRGADESRRHRAPHKYFYVRKHIRRPTKQVTRPGDERTSP